MKRFVWIVAVLVAGNAQAHIGYGGRDFGSFDGVSEASVAISNQAVGGNHGWADATDADFGDSHHGRAFRFTLEGVADVTLAVEANAAATETSVGGLLPAYSIYAGLAHLPPAGPDYDSTDVTLAYLATLPGPAKEGAWNALDDFQIGNEDGDLSSFGFAGYAADGDAANFGATPGIVGDGAADGFVSQTFRLDAGDYTIFIGGADYDSQLTDDADLSFGIAATLTVPEPGAALTQVVALAALGLARRSLARRVHRDGPEVRPCVPPSRPWRLRCDASSQR